MSIFPDERCTCPLRKDAARCIQRQNWTPQPRECRVCDFYGRKAADVTKGPQGDTKPVPRGTIPAKSETTQPKTEEVKAVPEAKPAREKVLSRIQKEKSCNRGRLMNYCGLNSTEVGAATEALEKEGMIKSWRVSAKSVIYTLPNAPDPRPAATGSNQQQPAATGRKTSPAPEKRLARSAAKKPADAGGSPPPKNGGGRTSPAGEAIAAALTELKHRRELIDKAIQHLEEVSS